MKTPTELARELSEKIPVTGTLNYQDTDSVMTFPEVQTLLTNTKNLTDQEILDLIKRHKFIIITGTSRGRERIRKLLLLNLGPKRIVNTRGYISYGLVAPKELTLKQKKTTWIALFEIRNPAYDQIKRIVDVWSKKRAPVIIDSWSDVELGLKQEIYKKQKKETVGKDGLTYIDLSLYRGFKIKINHLLTTLGKYKKQIILFADWKDTTEWENGLPTKRYFNPGVHKWVLQESTLILLAEDNKTSIYKEK